MNKKQWYIEKLEGKTAEVSVSESYYEVEFRFATGHWDGGDNQDFQSKLAIDLKDGKPLEANIERLQQLFNDGKLVVTGSTELEILFGKWIA